ncbi:hypothetical protein [Acinetobacter sp. ANC 5414]|jgi:prefoldin subunit 5|uniref:hypothetical protein n=1 Tax=Acinetobacter sp. ANC 5414 TaxID=2731251 RepID=UPI00148FD28B|nr:hypothetical protein [Acinetobacter sp. ANC 5414]NNH01703.1 hypothetical protein [Acinetobacter sp. ANC 5414]
MNALEERLPSFMTKLHQFDSNEARKNQLKNDLFHINANLKKLASNIEKSVHNLVFIDLDDFLTTRGWKSEIEAEKNKTYKKSNNFIKLSPISTLNTKISFLVGHNLVRIQDHCIELSFKDVVLQSAIHTAKLGIEINNGKSIDELEDCLKKFQMIKSKLEESIVKLDLSQINLETFKANLNSRKKQPNLREAIIKILETI